MTSPISRRNEKLKELYCRKWAELSEIKAHFQNLSKPCLAWVHPNYEKSAIRLVVVGQETNDWGSQILDDLFPKMSAESAVEKLMKIYQDFELGKGYGGSFWPAVHELYGLLNPEGLPLGFVSLNISKFCQNKTTPSAEVLNKIIATGLLNEEIKILEPDVVVFHTGPKYEWCLKSWFPDLKLSVDDKWLAQLESSGLPTDSFRSYHPGYLNRKSRRAEIYNRIIAEVTQIPPVTG